MSTSSWKKWLPIMLGKASVRDKPPRVAILGIGNEFNGDDAAGVLTARYLIKKLENYQTGRETQELPDTDVPCNDRLLVLDAGLAPENFTGTLRKYKPDTILLIDAAQLDESVGSIFIVSRTDLAGFSASTHLQPLSTFADFLGDELGCQVQIIGIQPGHLDFDRPVSTKVRAACRSLANGLADLFLVNS